MQYIIMQDMIMFLMLDRHMILWDRLFLKKKNAFLSKQVFLKEGEAQEWVAWQNWMIRREELLWQFFASIVQTNALEEEEG